MNQYKFESGFNVKKFIIVIAVVLLVVYGFFNARNLIKGPQVEIFNPIADMETEENILIVKGVAKNVTSISLNERPININPDGMFEEKLLLSPGSNIIEIKASDRFKKSIQKSLKVYYKQNATTTTETNL